MVEKAETVRVNVYMSKEIRDYYEQQAARVGASMSAVMAMALLESMERQQADRKR